MDVMREIKFRAWNKSEKTMGDSFTIQSAIGSRKWMGIDTDGIVYLEGTGLNDKNGKGIFEGDVLRGNSDFVDEVFWNDGCFEWNLEPLSQWHTEKLEIVGNIYENPELLER